MQRFVVPSCLVAALLFCALLVGPSLAQTTIAIQVSPSILNLDSQGVWVTIHADIAYRDVDGFTVTLNGIPVEVVKADSRGDLVAKFCLDDVKDILEPGKVALTLTGVTSDGASFVGTTMVKVVQVSGVK